MPHHHLWLAVSDSPATDGRTHRHALTALMALVIGWSVVLAPGAFAADKPPVHLFLLSGQSNMANLDPAQVFIPEVQKHFGADNVVVVKVAQKSQPIRRWYQQWVVTGKQDQAEIGDLYVKLMQQTKVALAGRTIRSATLIWMQGERDAKESLSALYEEAFLGIVEQIKVDLGVQQWRSL
jgi:hypothetical protein